MPAFEFDACEVGAHELETVSRENVKRRGVLDVVSLQKEGVVVCRFDCGEGLCEESTLRPCQRHTVGAHAKLDGVIDKHTSEDVVAVLGELDVGVESHRNRTQCGVTESVVELPRHNNTTMLLFEFHFDQGVCRVRDVNLTPRNALLVPVA